MDVSIDPTRPERAVFGSIEEGLIEIESAQIAQYWNPQQQSVGLECQLERAAVFGSGIGF